MRAEHKRIEEVSVADPRSNLAPHLLMIAGGTGITPMYQIIKSSMKDASDKTKISLIYANVEENDIRQLACSVETVRELMAVLRKELEDLAAKSHGRFTLYVS